MKYTLKKSDGFTLVETLVAIAVLMIGVAGPLAVASRGLNAALYSRDQMTATFLAQETMEYVKNIRDNNLENGSPWLQGLDASPNCAGGATCAGSLNDGVQACSPAVADGCRLYISSSGYYSALDLSGTKTTFKRYFTLDPVVGNAACTPSTSHECRLHVTVEWDQGSIPYKLDLFSQVTDSQR